MLGSWWAYYELGWGGWWFWDPVENASFMPWLAGTALIHSLAVTEKRGLFKSWTVLLAIFAFALSLLGTFLVRSGVLTSVHAFATDPARGPVYSCFPGDSGRWLTDAIRFPCSRGEQSPEFFDWVSRESLLLFNNVVFPGGSTLTVLFGTLFPADSSTRWGRARYSVGPPYFNAVFVPLMALLMPFMGLGPVSRWKEGFDLSGAGVRSLLVPATVAVLCGVTLPLLHAPYNIWMALAVHAFLLAGAGSRSGTCWNRVRIAASVAVRGLNRLTPSATAEW